jgi:hypothetical protein
MYNLNHDSEGNTCFQDAVRIQDSQGHASHKASSSGRLPVSYSHPCHISFLSPSRPAQLHQQAAASRLQPISINHLSPSQHHYYRLNHFRIHLTDNEFKKTN